MCPVGSDINFDAFCELKSSFDSDYYMDILTFGKLHDFVDISPERNKITSN